MATIDTSYHVWNDETVEVQRGCASERAFHDLCRERNRGRCRYGVSDIIANRFRGVLTILLTKRSGSIRRSSTRRAMKALVNQS